MQWHDLPPRTPEECRFRTKRRGHAGAVCGLVRAALPDADDRVCAVPRQTCAACCDAAPASETAWNPVVSALVYRAAADVLEDRRTTPDAARSATAAQTRALRGLERIDPPTTQEREPLRSFAGLADLSRPLRRRRDRIRRWAVGITTAPRPQPALEACLASLRRAGWETPHLFMDGAVRVPAAFDSLPGTLRSPAVGAWPNHYLALLELTLRQPDADAYLLAQDDAIFYDREDLRAYLESALWPAGRWPIVSLYCPAPYTARRPGWSRLGRAWVWGATALVFPGPVARHYLSDRTICEHRWQSPSGGLTQIDALLGWWAKKQRIPFWLPTPSLVQHIGAASTLWPDSRATGPRAASWFAGDAEDRRQETDRGQKKTD